MQGLRTLGALALVLAVVAPVAGAQARGPGPQAQVTSAPDETFKHRPAFRFEADAPDATFECSLDGRSFRNCSSPYRPGHAGIGAHTFSVRAVDTAGTPGPPTPEHGFRVVNTEIVGRPAKATFARSLEFRLRLRGAGDGPLDLECSVDGHRYKPCSENFRTGRLGFGAHRLAVRGVLDEGRDPSPASHRFRIERRRITFGHSVNGRAIRAYRIGDPEARRKALVVGSIHGDETEGHEIVERVRHELRDISHVEIWVVQTVNPDGVARRSRTNAHGVDLNRNFSEDWNGSVPPSSEEYAGPHPFSEPESRAVRDLTKRVRPDVTVWYHQPWNAVLGPCGGASSIQREYARASGMRISCRGAGLPGTARNWMNANVGGHAFVVELGGGELGSGAVRRHTRAVAQVAKRG